MMKMMSKCMGLFAALGAIIFGSGAFAQTPQPTVFTAQATTGIESIALQPLSNTNSGGVTTTTRSLSVAKFPAALGTLLSTTVEVTFVESGVFAGSAFPLTMASIQGTNTALKSLTLPWGQGLNFLLNHSGSTTVASGSPAFSIAYPQKTATTGQIAVPTGSTPLVTGMGTVNFQVSPIQWIQSAFSSSTWSGMFTMATEITATVRYTYLPAVTNLGGGTTGQNGVPQISVAGPLLPGSNLTVSLTSAAPNAAVFLAAIVGPGMPIPFSTGTFHAAPNPLLVPVTTDGLGNVSRTSFIPPSVPSGLTFIVQCAVVDAAAGPSNVAISDGLLLLIQ